MNEGIVMHDKVDGRNPKANHLGCFGNPVNNVINYQPQLVTAGFLPSTVFLYVYTCCNATLTQQESDFLVGVPIHLSEFHCYKYRDWEHPRIYYSMYGMFTYMYHKN